METSENEIQVTDLVKHKDDPAHAYVVLGIEGTRITVEWPNWGPLTDDAAMFTLVKKGDRCVCPAIDLGGVGHRKDCGWRDKHHKTKGAGRGW